MTAPNAATVWRDYITDGVPTSGAYKPTKASIREWGADLEGRTPVPVLADKGKILVVKSDGSGYDLISPNQRLAKTAAYTVVDGDYFKTIALGGSAFYELTFSAASGYRSNFISRVVNEDTGRGKRIKLGSADPFILWPGQSIIVYASNNIWYSEGRTTRFKLGDVGNISYFYVDPANGTAGVGVVDGLATSGSGCFKYVQDAINNIIRNIDCNNNLPNIKVISQVNGEQIVMAFAGQPIGSCQIRLEGDPTGVAPIKWVATANNQTFAQCRDMGILTFDGFDFTAGSYTGCIFLDASQQGVIDYESCWFGPAPSGTHIRVQQGGSVNSLDTASSGYKVYGLGSSAFHWDCYGPFKLNMGGATISVPNALTFGSFLRCQGPGMVNFGPNTFTGTGAGGGSTGQKYAATLNSVISLGGTVLPGNGAGATATGGQAVA